MANNRIFYAVQQVGFRADGVTDATNFTALHGVQSVGMTTNFNLSQVFELGQISIYENIEDIPDVEVSLTKVLDSQPLIYTAATTNAASPTLSGRQNAKSVFALAIWPDTNDSAKLSTQPDSQCECSGLFVSSISYNFPVDGEFTEDVTLVGNHKMWHNDPKAVQFGKYGEVNADFTGAFTDTGEEINLDNGGVQRRENLLMGAVAGAELDGNGANRDPDISVFPTQIHGISADGTNRKTDGQNFDTHIQNITVSTDLGREEIFELGRKAPYHRFATFPVEVTCDIEVIAVSGDMVSAIEEGILTPGAATGCVDSGNLVDETIRIATCDGTRIYLGKKNKLSSVSYGGGDAGGGNATVTYSYSTFNDFTVMHEADTNSNFTWAGKITYLGPA
jgi:hypothetical protein